MSFGSNSSISILYDQIGRKLRKTAAPTAGGGYTQDYVDGLEYRTNSGGALTLEAIYHAEGRITPVGASYQYEYNIKDHLGNTRLTFADLNANGVVDVPSDILQENHYYPFGLKMNYTWMDNVALDNKYQYNGKELNDDLGLNWYAYGRRWYDPTIARFVETDPIADKFPDLSTYNYASNKPINGIDLHGLQWVHYQYEGTNVINVNVDNEYTGTALSKQEFEDYLLEASRQFKNTLEQSSNRTFTGTLTFTEVVNNDQVVPHVSVSDFVPTTALTGASGFGSFSLSTMDKNGNLRTPEDFALEYLHEILHTARLDHPFEVTQSSDTEMVHDKGQNYLTTKNTSNNILYNIMNYPVISINGNNVGDLLKAQRRPADMLTIGQLNLMAREVDGQMQGAGMFYKKDYTEYWLDYPGKRVKQN